MRRESAGCGPIVIALAALCVGLIICGAPARAQEYPTRPIQFVVTTAAGGALDLIARTTAERLTEAMRQPVVIENLPAGNGSVAAGQEALRTDGQAAIVDALDALVARLDAGEKVGQLSFNWR